MHSQTLIRHSSQFRSLWLKMRALVLLISLAVAASGSAIGPNAESYPGQVVFLGDSITYFWQQNGWQQWAEFYNPVGAINTGWPGDWTFDVVNKLNAGLIDSYVPRLVVLLIGTNDLGGGAEEDSVVTNIGSIISLVQAKIPGVQFLLVGVLPRTGVDVHTKIRSVNARLSTYADSQADVHFLDMDSAFSNQLGTLLPGMSDDGVHLTAQGYATWSQNMNPLFFAILDNAPVPTAGPTTPPTSACTNAVFLGDSITDFFDSDGASTWNQFYAPLGAINTGVSGDWTYDTINRIVDGGILNGLNEKVAVLKIGTNDLSAAKDEIVVAGNIGIIISLIKDRSPDVKIILLGILPRTGADVHSRVRIVNQLIAKHGEEENVTFLDMETSFSTELGVVKPELFTDGLHLTGRGYEVWAEVMNPIFFELLNPTC